MSSCKSTNRDNAWSMHTEWEQHREQRCTLDAPETVPFVDINFLISRPGLSGSLRADNFQLSWPGRVSRCKVSVNLW